MDVDPAITSMTDPAIVATKEDKAPLTEDVVNAPNG